QLRDQLGLNDPIWVQYLHYMQDLLRGDLGTTLITRQPAWDQIQFVLPHTLELTFAALVIALALGIPIGIITAVRQNTPIDYTGRIFSLAGLSLPAFYLGLLLMFLFSARLGWLPA